MFWWGVSLECLFSIADGDEFSGCSAALSQSSSELDWITGLLFRFPFPNLLPESNSVCRSEVASDLRSFTLAFSYFSAFPKMRTLYCDQFASGVTQSFTALLILTLPGGQKQESSAGPVNHLQGIMDTPPPSRKSTTANGSMLGRKQKKSQLVQQWQCHISRLQWQKHNFLF